MPPQVSSSRPSSALETLKGLKAARREWLRRLEPELRRGSPGQSLTAALSNRWDDLLSGTYEEILGDRARLCALIALGGYGRRAMLPYSDVDLMVLVPDDAPSKLLRLVERFIQELWSAGVKLGHSVRTRSQCVSLARDDMSVATSLLDARPIAGMADVVGPLRELVVRELRTRNPRAFVELVREGVRQRRRKFGDSAYLLEPQVKQGRGGLRDLHAVRWAAKVLFETTGIEELVERGLVSAEEAGRLESAHSFLLRARFALHVHHGWKQDQLTYAAQAKTAALLGFGEEFTGESISRLMKGYYLHARSIATISDLWLEEWALGDDDSSHCLTTHDAPDLMTEPSAMWPLLQRAIDERRRLHPSLRRALGDSVPRLRRSAAFDPNARQVVRRIICQLDDPENLLQLAVDTGLLARVVPEWAHLTAHAQHDTYHVYTTDVHLLITCQRMKALLRGELESRSAYLSRLAHRYASHNDTEALLVATLLHDVGKGMSADHSIIGAGMAAESCKRLGLSDEDQELVRELVLEHLTMPKVSQRRDLNDPATLDSFSQRVGRPELLDALTLLSFVDMDSVGPGHLNDWKLSLLVELHRAASDWLREEGRQSIPHAAEAWDLVSSVLEGDVAASELEALRARLPERLLGSAPVPQLVRCARLLFEGGDTARTAFHDALDGGMTEVLVYEPARHGHFAEVAAILDAARLDITRARTSSLGGGGTLEIFEVRTADASRTALPERLRRSLADDLDCVITGAKTVEELLTKKLRSSGLPPKKRPSVATSVLIDNEFDPLFTIVEVKAPDAPGLLAHLTRSLRDLALQVDRSIITTEGDRAIDTFYVTDDEGGKLDDAAAHRARRTLLSSLEAR